MTEEIKEELLHIFTTEVFTTDTEVLALYDKLSTLGLLNNSLVLPHGVNHHIAPRYFKEDKPKDKTIW